MKKFLEGAANGFMVLGLILFFVLYIIGYGYILKNIDDTIVLLMTSTPWLAMSTNFIFNQIKNIVKKTK